MLDPFCGIVATKHRPMPSSTVWKMNGNNTKHKSLGLIPVSMGKRWVFFSFIPRNKSYHNRSHHKNHVLCTMRIDFCWYANKRLTRYVTFQTEIKTSGKRQSDDWVSAHLDEMKLELKNYNTCQTNEAIIDVATGRIFIDRPPNMYSEILFCLCFEKKP